MKIFLSVICLFLLISCGPSQKEKQRIAAVTCSVMRETNTGVFRVEKLNEAREKIGGEPFLRGSGEIRVALRFELCEELILNENYDEKLQELRERLRVTAEKLAVAAEKLAEEQRVAAEKLAEEQRIAAEKRAEERRIARRIAEEKRAKEERIAAEKKRIAAEKKRIADSKPTVKERFHSNGELRSRTNYQSKNDGGRQHGIERYWHNNGQLSREKTYKNGEEHGLTRSWYKDGQISGETNYSYGDEHGRKRSWGRDGSWVGDVCYNYGKIVWTMSEYNSEFDAAVRKICLR